MYAPIDVTEGNRKRQLLLQKLMQQQGMGTPPSVARPVFGAGRPFFSFNNLPPAPRPQLTRPFPIPPGLMQLLGPGSTGTPLPGEFSPGPGIPVGDPGRISPPPGQISSPSGPPAGPPPNGPGRALYGESEPPIFSPDSPYYTEHPQITPSQWAAMQPAGSLAPAAPIPTPSSDLIPLGGGGYFNPTTGTVHGNPGSHWFAQ